MKGPEHVRKLVRNVLAAAIPPKIDELEARLGLAPDALEELKPQLVAAEDRRNVATEDWPHVLVIPVTAGRVRRVDVVDGQEVFLFAYPLRVVAMVRDQDFGAVAELRDRLILAVREVLFSSLDLGDPTAGIDPSTYKESYSDVAPVGDRAIAGAYAELDVTIEESVPATPAGTATTVVIHPGLLDDED